MNQHKELLEVYIKNKKMIKNFLKNSKNQSDRHRLTELMFCILTSQTKAEHCRAAVCKMDIFQGNKSHISNCLKGIRFSKRKTEYLFEARKKLLIIKKNLNFSPELQRDWLVKNVKGMGMKLASHYLRNIGVFGLAILDIHVQRYLKEKFRFVGKVGALSKKQYLENEKIYLTLSKKLKIPPEELDIAIWMYGNSSGKFYG